MPPKKKTNKISLNDFLADQSTGSWADEMDALPSAPAVRSDDDPGRDRFSRRGDDFLASKPDRTHAPPREDLPLPTSPPYTAFVGNLAFDLTESELEDFFRPLPTKSVKIIRDRDDKPKGFGYVEFEDLESLKEAISKTGMNFSNRAVRISVAEPPKERDRPGFGHDDSKFDGPWRREKPPPGGDFAGARGRRFEGSHEREKMSSVSDGISDWRSQMHTRQPHHEESGPPSFRRRGSGFAEANTGLADSEEKWTIGSRFKPSAEEHTGPGGKFGGFRGSRADSRSPKEEDGDWRSGGGRSRANRGSTSPTGSTPPTPQMGGRRKLELLPRSTTSSIAPSPVSSPLFSPASAAASHPKANPFGNAKPVDSLSREMEIEEKIKTHGLSMSRNSSKTGNERSGWRDGASHGATDRGTGSSWRVRGSSPASSERAEHKEHPEREKPPVTIVKKVSTAPNVRPTLSFAKAAKGDGSDAAEEKKE